MPTPGRRLRGASAPELDVLQELQLSADEDVVGRQELQHALQIPDEVAEGVEVRTAELGSHGCGPDCLEVVVSGKVVWTPEIVASLLDEARQLAEAVKAIHDHGFGSA